MKRALSLLVLSAAFSAAIAQETETTPKKFLGIPLSYGNDPEVEGRIDAIIEKYRASIKGPSGDALDPTPLTPAQSKDFLWWQKEVGKPIDSKDGRPVTLEEMFLRALKNSTQIKVFSDVPLIRETGIQEAKGQFDTRAFVASAYDYTNDPVGSLLETGSADGRFTQSQWTNEFGVAKKLVTGADVRLSQEFGTLTDNSEFLTPDPQGNSRLKLSVIQPLVNGAGVAYNTALIEIARLDTRSAYLEQIRQSESHLLEVCRSYWALFLARVGLIQKRHYLDGAVRVEAELNGRSDVDAIASQLVRARSAVAFRKSDLIRSVREVANAQDRLLSLVNDPDLAAWNSGEIIPIDPLLNSGYPIDYEKFSRKALAQRSEVLQGIQGIRAASIREKMSRNQILPVVNLLLEGYVAGIEPENNFATAWSNQFDEGAPGFKVGIRVELPIENNAAKAKLERRRLEMRQLFNQFQTTVDTVLLEVKVSTRELETAWKDFQANLESVAAAAADLNQLKARQELDAVAGTGETFEQKQSQSEYLDRVLDSQSRLQIAEMQLAMSATVCQVAVVGLERAMGNLLKTENITVARATAADGLPVLELQKNGGSPDGKSSPPPSRKKP